MFPVRTVMRNTTSPLCVRISKTSTRANQESLYVGLFFFSFISRHKLFIIDVYVDGGFVDLVFVRYL